MNAVIFIILAYSILSFGYLIFRYCCSTVYSKSSLKQQKLKKIPKVSIIIPNYNEDPADLKKCILSACKNSYPNKEVIFVDDGSTKKDYQKVVEQIKKDYPLKVIEFEKNKGKREAMFAGFNVSTGEFLITMDSDSIIVSGESILELIKPFNDKNVGAVSGNVQVLNKNKSLLAKMQWARYWLAFNVEKAAQSPYDSVTCCSGPFSAYRKEYLMSFLEEWNNQVFLGKKCTYGDDRGLTTLMLRNGYKVQFARYALCLTNVPEKFSKFTKQQIRWKKSFIRENWYISKFIRKKNPLMQLEFFWFWFNFFVGYFVKLAAVYLLIFDTYTFMQFSLMIVFAALLHYNYVFIRHPGEMGLYGVAYTFLNEFWISWFFWYGLATLKETNWGTR